MYTHNKNRQTKNTLKSNCGSIYYGQYIPFFLLKKEIVKPGSIKDTDLTSGWKVQPTDGSSSEDSNGP